MPRQILMKTENGPQVLGESLAHNEKQLQETLKENPALLPLEDLDLVGPPLVVGRETTLPSGDIDLALLARGGELVLVEFKTGPQNPDFRAALAQLLDYGSDLWQMTYEQFEIAVAARYFSSEYAKGTAVAGCRTILDAAKLAWPDLSDEDDESALPDRLGGALATGTFNYVVAAQRFTPAMETTCRYLNAHVPKARFFLVEMVRFVGDDAKEAFEARVVLRPDSKPQGPTGGGGVTPQSLADNIPDETYRTAVFRLLEGVTALGMFIFWGKRGISLRWRGSDSKAVASVGWVHPPGPPGWSGLTDVVLGYLTSSPAQLQPVLAQYAERVREIPGASPTGSRDLVAFHFGPDSVVANIEALVDALASVVAELGSVA